MTPGGAIDTEAPRSAPGGRGDAEGDSFLRNSWYVAAFSQELADGRLVARRILGEPMLVYRTSDGAAVALHDQCPHRLAPLSAGRRIDDAVRCGYHGLVFAADGRCTHVPGQARIPPRAKVRTFPAVERHGRLWVWPAERERADAALIPSLPWAVAGDDWGVVEGYLNVAADYRLLSDNLLDLGHETYVHEGTIGNQAAQAIADYPVRVSITSDGVVVADREMADIDPPPWFARVLGGTAKIDRWQTAIWAAPSLNVTDTAVAPAGLGRPAGAVGRILHLLTPETATATHYFWSVSRNYQIDDADMSEGVRRAICDTFEEDRAILEQQQQRVTASGLSVPQVTIGLDAAPVHARHILAACLRAERDGASAVRPFAMPDHATPSPTGEPVLS